MPKIWEDANNISEAVERRKTFILNTQHKVMKIISFSANVRHCNITCSGSHVQVCFQIFFICYYIAFLPASV